MQHKNLTGDGEGGAGGVIACAESLRASARMRRVRWFASQIFQKHPRFLLSKAPGWLLIEVSALRKPGFETVYSAHYKSDRWNSFINPTGNNLFREAFENTVEKHGGTRDVIKHARPDGTTRRCSRIKIK